MKIISRDACGNIDLCATSEELSVIVDGLIELDDMYEEINDGGESCVHKLQLISNILNVLKERYL